MGGEARGGGWWEVRGGEGGLVGGEGRGGEGLVGGEARGGGWWEVRRGEGAGGR